MYFDVIVIGGGPAGMIAAGTCASRGRKTLLLEKNEKLGKKLYITGKGRCNITNLAEKEEFFANIPKNNKFFYSAFNNLTNIDLINLLNDLGLKTKVERGGRVFPLSDKASDVIKALEKYMNNNNLKIRLHTAVKEIIISGKSISGIKLAEDEIINCKSVILCTGGISYPHTGSTGDGHKIAQSLGHTITDLNPSLVPLVIKESYVKDLQGLSLKNVEIKIFSDDKLIYKDFGEMLFTHYGVSGPIILSASFYAVEYLKKGKAVKLTIDLKPALNEIELDRRILRDFELNSKKLFKNSLDDLLPKKLIPVVIALSNISPDKQVHQITKEERKQLVYILKSFELNIIGTRSIQEAIVTSGGVNLKEINPKTMESKLIKGLYFAGEILDLDAFTGGFNLQIAFSTGYTAGMNA